MPPGLIGAHARRADRKPISMWGCGIPFRNDEHGSGRRSQIAMQDRLGLAGARGLRPSPLPDQVAKGDEWRRNVEIRNASLGIAEQGHGIANGENWNGV